jgi:hypothetical protein
MPGSFPADVSGAGAALAGGNGTGAAFDITAVSEPNTVLADIPNPAPNDFAFVLEDETHDGETWRYGNLDYNGDGIFNWVPVIELGDTGRDFTADPLTAGELGTNAVTETKIANGAVTLAKLASVNLTGIMADAADYATTISGSFTEVFTSLFGRIRGLHSSAVKKTGDQTIAGTKTFSTAPVIPSVTAFPGSPSATKPATEAEVKALADTKQAALVSGTNIKSINGQSILGNGNLTISADGGVRGNLSAVSVTYHRLTAGVQIWSYHNTFVTHLICETTSAGASGELVCFSNNGTEGVYEVDKATYNGKYTNGTLILKVGFNQSGELWLRMMEAAGAQYHVVLVGPTYSLGSNITYSPQLISQNTEPAGVTWTDVTM